MKRVSLHTLLKIYFRERMLGWRSERYYSAVIGQFERWLGRPAFLSDVCRLGDDYVWFRRTGGQIGEETVRASGVTAASHRAALATLMKFAVRQRWCRKVTIRPIRKPRVIPHALLFSEIGRLLQHASPRQRAAILLCFDTGFRRGDVFDCRWSETFVRDGRTFITRIVQKTGRVETRELRPITVEACLAIRVAGNNYLLPGSRNAANWTACWQRLGSKAGVNVTRRGLQAVRRAGASYIAKAGGSARKYLGHATDGLAERYYLDPRIVGDTPDLPPGLE